MEEEAAWSSAMQIQQSPQSRENIPVEGGLSLQEIYLQNIPSVVSISCTGYNTEYGSYPSSFMRRRRIASSKERSFLVCCRVRER